MIAPRTFCATLCCMLALLCAHGARADSPGVPTRPVLVTPVDAAWRAALPRDPAAATEAYLARLTPEARSRSDAYFEGGYWLQLWSVLLDVGIALLLLATRAAAWLRERTARLSRSRLVQTGLFGAAWLLVTWLLTLPMTIYAGYVREHQYGLATQTFGPWLGERLIGLGLTLAVGAVVVAVLYAVLRRAPRRWWIGAALLGVLFMVFGSIVSPVYVDPIFNTYKSLDDGPVKASLLSMARANGVPASDILEFDASRQTTRISANVSGLFGSAAIRLNDNLLRRTSPETIKAVTAHEMGHYVLNHAVTLILWFGVLIVPGFALVSLSFERVHRRFGAAWRVAGVADPAGLPLLAALFSIYLFVLTPLINTIVRTQEVEADSYGLNAAREPDGFADAALAVVEYRKADPGVWEERIFFDHPSARNRIFAAMRWKAENPR